MVYLLFNKVYILPMVLLIFLFFYIIDRNPGSSPKVEKSLENRGSRPLILLLCKFCLIKTKFKLLVRLA
jgi:hypothetical protein